MFLIPKPGGKFRPVINFKNLNQCVTHHHFKMEGLHLVRSLLQEIGENWPKRCVFHHSNLHQQSEIPLESKEVPVLLPVIWAIISSLDVYKGSKICDCLPSYIGYPYSSIHRQSSSSEPVTSISQGTRCPGNLPLSSARFRDKLGEIRVESSTEDNKPLLCDRLPSDDNQPSKGNSPEGEEGSSFNVTKKEVSLPTLASFIGLACSTIPAVLPVSLWYRNLQML